METKQEPGEALAQMLAGWAEGLKKLDAAADAHIAAVERLLKIELPKPTRAEQQEGTDPQCRVEAGTDNVTYCANMAWMLAASDRAFRIGNRVPRRAESYTAVMIDLKGGHFSFCDYCPFCGAHIATRKPGGDR